MAEKNPDLKPDQTTPPEEWLFGKLPESPTNYKQAVLDFCRTQGLKLEDGLVTLLMHATTLCGAGSPGAYFLGQIPGEAEQSKLNDYCLTENLDPEAAILSLLNRALEQPQILDEARKSPFVAQAQAQLGTYTGASPAFTQRQQKPCEQCGEAFKPRNIGQRFCENPSCWAAAAGFQTEAQKSGQEPTSGSQEHQRLTRLEGMFQELMRTMQSGQHPPLPIVTGATSTRTQ
jgi:hypothetical protein